MDCFMNKWNVSYLKAKLRSNTTEEIQEMYICFIFLS